MASRANERDAISLNRATSAILVCSVTIAILAASMPVQEASAGGGGRRSGVTGECSDSICEVSMTGGAFTPETLKIRPGATVAWTSDDKMPHTITGGSRTGSLEFDSGVLSPTLGGKQWEMKFERPGTFDYFCKLHKGMAGQVIVAGEPVEDYSRLAFMLVMAAGVFGTFGAVAALRLKKKG